MIWLGRFCQKSLGLFGTNIWLTIDDVPTAAHGHVVTIIVGHLVIQSLTLHADPKHANANIDIGAKYGPWDKSLITIWPTSRKVNWPPRLSFTNKGSIPIATLMDRWRIGTAV